MTPERQRHAPATTLAVFCAITVVFLVVRDLTIPQVRDTEVWFGFEFRGLLAWLTAPIHWALFATFAWGFWSVRPWVWTFASAYAVYIAVSHVIWNLVSPLGGGAFAGVWQFVLFSVPVLVLQVAKRMEQGREAD